jgi:hypothetical protein
MTLKQMLLALRLVAAAACGVIAGGCAVINAADCGPDWYSTGKRDGRLGAYSQAELYAARCAGPVDTARYMDGWQAGLYERPIPVI